jgi:hypothetical protein
MAIHVADDTAAEAGSGAGARWHIDAVLIACLAAGAVLRSWGLGHDLPNVYNPDESSIVLRALSLGAKTLNPHNFVYPSLYFYVIALVVGCNFLVLRTLGRVASLKAFETAFLLDPSHVYLMTRLIPVIAGVATIAGVYALAQHVGSRRTARSAAALMAVAYVPVRDAHVVKHDVPATLLIVLVVLASWRVWKRGSLRDAIVAGALAGTAFALHYYGAFAVVPVAIAHLLRARSIRKLVAAREAWLSAAAFVAAFACLSPYVLVDHTVALRDIAVIRASVVGLGVNTFGWFGGGAQHLRIMAGQGAGLPMLVAAVLGVAAMVWASRASALWLLSFPTVFFVFISNSWPSGRTANPLYPFLAVAAAVGIDRIGGRWRHGALTVVVITGLCAAQPLVLSIAMDRFFSTDDTRTIARRWIEQHIPADSAVALPPGSVQLLPSRASLREALVRHVGSETRASRRFQAILALDPYPAPAYRLTYLGRGGMDQEKIYVDPDLLAHDGPLLALRQRGVQYVVLKQFSLRDTDPLRVALAAQARLVFSISPFNSRSGRDSVAQLPDYDIRPGLDVDRPGPLVEIWELR